MITAPHNSCGLSQSNLRRLPGKPGRRTRAMTLLEVMVSFTIFTMIAMGTLAAVIQTRRMSEDNVAQSTATVVAEGILEQVQLPTWSSLTDPTLTDLTKPNYLNLALLFSSSSNNNLASINNISLPWNSATPQPVGAFVIPTDTTSTYLGVLMDVPYMNGATVIRPARYMKMQVTINRVVQTNNDFIQVVLTYSWQPPSRNLGSGTPVWLTRELRTVRSQASSY